MQHCGFHFQNTYLKLPDVLYSREQSITFAKPEMVVLNQALAKSMDLTFDHLDATAQANLFAANCLPTGAVPLAQAYAGHQFGHFTMLGDGRAILWGEHMTKKGQRLDIQSKGSGPTVYSRQGDGRAALEPMLREYIISEAMHALGIPTTRALAVVKTGEDVIRQKPLPGAVLTRIATSHIRIGTFEFAATQQDQTILMALLDYTIDRHDPLLKEKPNKALALVQNVMERQIDLIAHWMRVGFIHGVINTDNTTISGETIDYGPCAFMDAYDPRTTFSSIDHMGRYAYGNQPIMIQWNIARLAEALLPLIDPNTNKAIEMAEGMLNAFTDLYQKKWLTMMRAKLGLFGAEKEDETLINDLLDWMQQNQADYTNTFYDLGHEENLCNQRYQTQSFITWHQKWQMRCKQNNKPAKESRKLMHQTNPSIIARNHKVEQALNAASEGNLSPLFALLSALKNPYQDDPNLRAYQCPPKLSERVDQTFCGT